MHENNQLHAHSALSRIRNYLGSHSLRYFAGAIAVIGRESGSGTRDGFESIVYGRGPGADAGCARLVVRLRCDQHLRH